MSTPTLSIIVPAYNEEAVLPKTYAELKEQLELTRETYEILFVNDGSSDSSRRVLDTLSQNDENVRVINLARNFGHELATTAGMHQARGKAAIVIDADLQDPPELMHEMIRLWREGYEVVYGVRSKREGESWVKKLTAFCFYHLISYIAEVPVPKNTGDFRLMDRRVIDVYRELKEDPRFFRGLISWIGFKQIGIPFVRRPRAAGVSKYRYTKLFKLAFDTITAFSILPSLAISVLAFGSAFLGFTATAVLLGLWAMQVIQFEAWQWAAIGFLNLFNLQFICLAVLGEYVVRTHRHTQQRPLFVIESIFEKTSHGQKTDSRAA